MSDTSWQEAANKRATGIRTWLEDNASHVFADQKHLDADSEARAYWHYGYLAALRDVLAKASS